MFDRLPYTDFSHIYHPIEPLLSVATFPVGLTIALYRLFGQFDYGSCSNPSSPPDGVWADLEQTRQLRNATAFLVTHTRYFHSALW